MIELNGVRDALATLTANAPRFYRAPGRLNLIGDHVDYSEGFVLPIAIDRVTLLAAAKRSDRIVRLRSLARGETVEFDLDDADERPRAGWNDDVRRIALGLEKRGAVLRGSDVAVRTTIPQHSGLASSASLGLAGALALLGTAGIEMPLEEVVAVCREVDGEVAPIASAMGKRDHALLIDCRSAEATTVPLVLSGVAIVVCDAHIARDRRALGEDLARRLARRFSAFERETSAVAAPAHASHRHRERARAANRRRRSCRGSDRDRWPAQRVARLAAR
jgi:galactokinase